MSSKKLSRAQKSLLEKKLKDCTRQLEFYCFESIQQVRELEDLQKHHVFCVLSFQNLDQEVQNCLINSGYQYMTTANFLIECAVLYKLLGERPAKLQYLHKQVLRFHVKLNGAPPANLLKDFQ